MRIDVWSDIACPWCYVGKRRLEAALARFPQKDSIELVWRAFELDTQAPPVRDPQVSYAERLSRKYSVPVADAQGMIERMRRTAAADGLDFRFDRIRPGNTFNAHRLLHLAHKNGLQDALKERLLRAYLSEGEAIGETAVLRRLAVDVGLDDTEVQAVLDSDRFGLEVRQDEAEASERGIRGVPFFVVAGRFTLSGAQPPDALLQLLTTAWQQLQAPPAGSEGESCGPEGCG